jgi:hypothetical protein
MNRIALRNLRCVAAVVLALAGAACSSGSNEGSGSENGGAGDDGSGGAGRGTGGARAGSGGRGGVTGAGGVHASGGDVGTGGGPVGTGGSENPDASDNEDVAPNPGTGGSSGPTPTGYLFGAHPLMYPAGTLRPTGDQKALDDAVAAAYDKWKAAYVKPGCGGFVVATQGGEPGEMTSSTALGRAMILAVMMAGHDPDAQKLFDGLFAVGRAKHSIYKGNEALLAYSVGANCATPADDGSLFGGDADFAFALLLAD